MIGSVFEQRDQLAQLERRREQIAAGGATQQAAAAATMPAGAPLAGGMPSAGYAPAPAAFKSADPDIGKRRKKERSPLKDHDLRGQAATSALGEGRGYRDAMDDEDSRKSFRDLGVAEGPADFAEPGQAAEAEQFDRPYLSEGHSAESPQAEMPRQSPIVHAPQGIVRPISLPGAPVAGHVPAHVASSYSMGSPSERAR